MDTNRSAAISSFKYLVRCLLAAPEDKRTGLVGENAQPWCEVLERATRNMKRDLRPVVVPLLSAIMRQANALTPDQQVLVGAASQRILSFAWGESHRDSGMIRCAIEGICRTFEATPNESAAILRRILDPQHLATHGFDELPTLVRELDRLVVPVPKFVEEVYCAALSFTETDDTPTSLGGESAIMPLQSNRRQDYKLALHHLGKLFPRFMNVAPVEATGAVIAAVNAEMAEKADVPVQTITGDVILLDTFEARFAEDLSHIWDSTRHRHETHLQLLDGFEAGLVRLAGQDGDSELLNRVLERVARDNRFAAVWRRVLAGAIQEPSTLGLRVSSLATAIPVLVAGDTVELIGNYLPRVFPLLAAAEREAIERAIMSIQANDPKDVDFFTRRQNRLLGCLPESHLVTSEAKARLKELEAVGGPPANTPLFELGEVIREEFTEARWLEEQGVEMDAESNKRLHVLAGW
jgi:hypothetical protein